MKEQIRSPGGGTGVLATVVLGHRRLVLLAWILLAVGGGATASTTIGRLTTDLSVSGQRSYQTDSRIAAIYHNGGSQAPTVVVATAPGGRSGAALAAQGTADHIFEAAAGAAPLARLADGSSSGGGGFVTSDGRSRFALIATPPSGDPAPVNYSPAMAAAARAAAPPGWRVQVTGLTQLQNTGGDKGEGVLVLTLVAGIAALAILIVVFRSATAVLPLVLAAATIPTIFLATLALTTAMGVSFIAEYLISLIGLGVAIDYSLLIVTRWRAARGIGVDNEDAVRQAMSTAGRACVFSGVTVALSLAALVVLPAPFLRSLGLTGLLIPLVSVAAALTLLPALLATLGPQLERLQLRPRPEQSAGWLKWGRLVYRLRVPGAVIGMVVIVLLVLPVRSLRVGEPVTASLASTGPAREGLVTLEKGRIPPGVLNPIEILVTTGSVDRTVTAIDGLPGMYRVVAPASGGYRIGGTAIVDALPIAESSTPAGQATVKRVAATLRNQPGVIGVGGLGAEQIAFHHAIYGRAWLLVICVVFVTMVFLVAAFRSIVLPLKAVILNLASVACAFGIMTLVWQEGHGSNLLWGLPATGAISQYVPVAVFAFLFGLSMDYEVFILSRMREEYDQTASTEAAVVHGLANTGRLVTWGAFVLFLSFAALSALPLTEIKVFATGVGAGIVVDALVIRSVLVPAIVGIFGTWNWWLPRIRAHKHFQTQANDQGSNLGVHGPSANVPNSNTSAAPLRAE